LADEARALVIDVAVAQLGLLLDEEAVRDHHLQVFLGARHCHVQQASRFLGVLERTAGHVGRDAAVDHVQQRHRFPFPAFGRIDGRQDQVDCGTASGGRGC